MIVKLRST
jgi:Listeria-Bacteroides repeat domain (List_Bact_rpt)